MSDLGWYVVHGDQLMVMLERAGTGDDPGLLLAELYVNSERDDDR